MRRRPTTGAAAALLLLACAAPARADPCAGETGLRAAACRTLANSLRVPHPDETALAAALARPPEERARLLESLGFVPLSHAELAGRTVAEHGTGTAAVVHFGADGAATPRRTAPEPGAAATFRWRGPDGGVACPAAACSALYLSRDGRRGIALDRLGFHPALFEILGAGSP